jgi:iron complex transport system substrate-binding protein
MKHLWMIGIVWLLAGCRSASNTADADFSKRPECIKNYSPQQDYFPHKTTVKSAQGFKVSYHKNYKVITVSSPWRDAKENFQYVLVQCGTPAPKEYPAAQVISVPVRSIAIMSTTHLGHIKALGLMDKLVAMSTPKLIYDEKLQAELQQRKIVEIGNNQSIQVEKVLALAPDLITTYGVGNPNTDAHPKLQAAGLKVGINAEYMESKPLGQAEWIKFTALFFNAEAKADREFDQTSDRYHKLAALAKDVKQRPTVFMGSNFSGGWYVAGGDSFAAQYLKDAGADYVWKDRPGRGSLPMSFEKVFDRSIKGQYWLNGSQKWRSISDIAQADPRYQKLAAFQSKKVFNNNARVNSKGGNDYWENGTIKPDEVLADLMKIFHPQLLPNHKFVYYQQLR